MGESDLDVDGHCDGVAEEEEHDAVECGWETAVEHAISKPRPEEDLTDDFEVSVPPGWPFAGCLACQEVFPA